MPVDILFSDKSVHIIEDFAITNHINLLNVFPVFRSYKGKSPLYFNYDMHWSPMGHKVMAQELESFIEATLSLAILIRTYKEIKTLNDVLWTCHIKRGQAALKLFSRYRQLFF